MVTDRGTFVRSTYCVRNRKTPELSMTVLRSKPHLLFRKDHLLGQQPQGSQTAITLSSTNGERRSRQCCSTAFVEACLAEVAEE